MQILRKIWPTPPKMDRSQYGRYRWRLGLMLLVWTLLLTSVVLFWTDMSFALKSIIAATCTIFVPDVSMIEQVFTPYERYEKEGL
jgi:hypothetical protein